MKVAPLTFSLDVEDHRPDGEPWPARFPDYTRRVLAFLEERSVRGTFFVVGEVGEANPDLVRAIAAAGHEVALHSWRHVALTEVDPAAFAVDVARGKAVLEDIVGVPVAGYRAPTASLVPATAWAVDALGEAGFRYSSSVISAHNPLFGWPGAPRDVFRWPNGLVEIPIPVAAVGSIGLPHLGGVYFRLLPFPAVRLARGLLERTSIPNLYCHPYDFDADEPRWAVGDVPRWAVGLLWRNRSRMFAKLGRLLDSGPVGPPLVERLDALGDVPPFDPRDRAAA
jgi:polysaccharide deacetylase family protein (PEP-CTERM system associated)